MGRRKKRPYVPKVKGCYECSQRRVSCDNLHPACGKCRSRGIACSGYGTRYRFRSDSTFGSMRDGAAKINVSLNGQRRASSMQPDHSRPAAFADMGAMYQSGLAVHSQSSMQFYLMEGVDGGGPGDDVIQDDAKRSGRALETCQVLVRRTEAMTTALPEPKAFNPDGLSLSLPVLGYLAAWKEALVEHFSQSIAPEMVVVDDSHNGWRHLLLPMARADDLVLDAVLAASAFHFSACGIFGSPRVDPHKLYARVIHRLQERQDLVGCDKCAKQAVVLSIIVLLVVVMINGCSDFPIIFSMLQSALCAIGGERSIVDGGELGDFSLRQIHKMRVYAAPLLSQYAGMQVIVSEAETSFDCLHYYDRLYPSFSTLFGSIAALRQQAFDIYVNRVTTNSRFTISDEDAIEKFVVTLKSLPDSPTGKHVLVWPCFIAASGSRRPENQAILRDFLKGQYHRNGFVNLQKALELLERIWACDFDQGEDWPSLLPKPQVFIM